VATSIAPPGTGPVARPGTGPGASGCTPLALAVSETGSVAGINQIDRLLGATLLLILAALVGLGLAESRPSVPTLPPGSATLTTAPPVTAAQPTTLPNLPTPSQSFTTPTTVLPPVSGPVTAVGDSILLDIQPQLTADIPAVSVDGLVSRQFAASVAVVQADRAAATLGNVLVVELGTNGAVTAADLDDLVAAASGVTRIVFVNVCVPRPWAALDNAVLADGVARHAGIAVLADWHTLAVPHPEWFTADQVHLNPDGAVAMAALITAYT
jgi:hypothetical protein